MVVVVGGSQWLGLSHVEGQLTGALQGIVVRGWGGGVGAGCCPLAIHCHVFCGGYQLWICDCGPDRGDNPPPPPPLRDNQCSQSA